jgi:hypothetical protein
MTAQRHVKDHRPPGVSPPLPVGQGRAAHDKQFSWPAYLANLRAAHKCKSAVLLVICWDASEASKCRAAIDMGHPGYSLVPIVIGPNDGQGLTGAGSWLTVLAGSMGAIDLEADDGRRLVLDAIRDTASSVPVTRTLEAIILGVASEAARAELEALMETKEYKNDFADRHEAIGEARGEAIGKAQAIVKILASRLIELSPPQRDQLTSCTDLAQLDQWLDRALTATTAGDLFNA